MHMRSRVDGNQLAGEADKTDRGIEISAASLCTLTGSTRLGAEALEELAEGVPLGPATSEYVIRVLSLIDFKGRARSLWRSDCGERDSDRPSWMFILYIIMLL